MKVYGRIDYTGTMQYQGATLNLEYIVDDYKQGLSLTKGYIGGGYISNAGWTVVTTIQNATDTYGTSANANLVSPHRYGGYFSSHINGYILWGDGGSYGLINKKMSFATENVTAIDNRSYGNYPSTIQHGIGYEPNGTMFGSKGYTLANSSTNYEKFTFNTDTFRAASDGSVYSGDQSYNQAWFDKNYGWSLASDGVTRRYEYSSETWSTRSPSPNYTLTLSYWGKGLPTKDGKSYVHPGGIVAPFMKFMHTTESYMTNPYEQTLNNDEQPTVMGQNHGYFAGGYNGVQNAHTDRVEYNTDTVIKVFDAPRALSAGCPMYSGQMA
jgi:hypothetical protein